jgi:hypothetical protein
VAERPARVVRFLALLFSWMCRLVGLWVLRRRIAHLGLSIVPTHADRVGGLAFLDLIP